MFKLTSSVVLTTTLLLAFPSHANDDNLRFGAGLGLNYSGIGGSAGYTNGNNVFTLSAGVRPPLNNATLGAGASWLRTDLIGQGGPDAEHALGIYVGTVGAETYPRFSSSRRVLWGAGPMYQFYENGPTTPGLVTGVGMMYGHTDDSFRVSVSLGYQF